MRVAQLDMTNSSHQCPSGLRQRTYSNIRTCVSSSSSAGCSPDIVLSTVNISYARVCGRIIGYQIGNINAFASQSNTIESVYVDGISLTHGSPRQHIWTFAAARDETPDESLDSKCPCIIRSEDNHGNRPPMFVGTNYFCDTGSESASIDTNTFFQDPLWDGAGCGGQSTCCTFNNPPWFYRPLQRPTTDNIVMRVCRNEMSDSEDIAIETIEIYVQ